MNVRGDDPAAGRYLMARMSEFCIDCYFDDFDYYCIPMRLTYDGSTLEPANHLPAKYPVVLFNGIFSSIGYGLASNIPPFNVAEVLDATIKLMRDPEAKIMLIPDSPTGCDILDEGQFKAMNKTGISKVTMRASTEIDYVNNIIHVKTLPYGGTTDDVIQSILAFKEKKVFEDIIEIKDDTVEGEVALDLFLKKDAKPEKVLASLYKKNTGLKATFPVGITVIDEFVDYEYGIKDLLLAWIDYRVDAVRSMLLNKYQNLLASQHINEVLIMIFNKDEIEDRIDEIVSISRKSKTTEESIKALMKRFKITSVQAKTLVDMRVRNFNKESYDNYLKTRDKVAEEIKEIESRLQDDDKLKEFIINQLEEGKKKYGRPRMSKIVKEDDKSDKNIPDTEHLLGISESGFIKKISADEYSSIGAVGKTSSTITVLKVNNRENILIVDSCGYVTKISISAIPDMVFEDFGVELNKFFNVKGSVKAVMELPSMDILKVKEESFGIIFITKNGLAKKVQISEFKKLTDTKQSINLNKGDEVASAIFALNSSLKDIVISTNVGNGIHLALSEIKNASISAKGTSMISLKDGEEVVSASLLDPKKKLLFYITSAGRAKVTETKYFPVMKRKDGTLSLINLQGDETLVGVASVDKNDIAMIFKKKSDPEQIVIKDLEPTTRANKGTKLIKTGRADTVVGYKIFTNK